MRYLGGKSKLATTIAAAILVDHGPVEVFWDPFCGGLSVARALAKVAPAGLVSDAHEGLIALYRAIAEGWSPPETVSEEEYHAARDLDDRDPLKAFIGFGCSFSGKWFGGYARSNDGQNYASIAARVIRRDVAELSRCGLRHLSFFDIEPTSLARLPLVIYCDPPYAGTTKYSLPFDSAAFWVRVQSWERVGVPVYVSEYACPAPHRVIWETSHHLHVGGTVVRDARTERLFRLEVGCR